MIEIIEFDLPGTPTAKGRPRFFNGRAVTDAKTRAAEQSILAAWLVTVGSREPHAGPVEIDLEATFTPANSWPKWQTQRATSGHWPHTKKPDIDNLIKIIDGLNGIAWVDDSQITHIRASKQYGPIASTRLKLHFHPLPIKENN